MTGRLVGTLAVAVMLLVGLLPSSTLAASAKSTGSVVRVGSDLEVSGTVDRVVVLDGNVHLTPSADVRGDVIIILGRLQRDPGASVGGSEYVISTRAFRWVPGSPWAVVVILLIVFLAYRAALWWAVSAIASTIVRTATFERWMAGWEPRPIRAVVIGLVGVALAIPAIGLLALSVVLVPIALIGLAALLLAAGGGLAVYREGHLWPRRLPRLAYAAYIALPPALEIGLILTAAGGVGAALRAISRSVGITAVRSKR